MKVNNALMKSNPTNAKRLLQWAVGGLAFCFLMAGTALAQLSLTNAAGIIINDASAATPYPSTITVSNVVGVIEKVTVRLNQIKHDFPDDIDVLLVSPGGKKILIMSDAGGDGALNGVDLTFDDAAAVGLFDAPTPVTTPSLATGTYKPTNFDNTGDNDDVVNAVAGTTFFTLGVLTNDDANGTWSLYVRDDSQIASGTIGSWTLNLQTTPVISVANNITNATAVITNLALTQPTNPTNVLTMAEDSSFVINFTLADSSTLTTSLTLSATNISDPLNIGFDKGTNVVRTAPVGPSGAVLGGAGANRTLTITPLANSNGVSIVKLFVSDGIAVVTNTFVIVVTNVQDAPFIAGLTNSLVITRGGVMTTNGSVSLTAQPIVVTNQDFDLPYDGLTYASLTMSAVSSDPSIVASNAVFFAGTGQTRTLYIAPNGSATGTVTLTIIVTDSTGRTGTTNITVRVDPFPDPTLFANTQEINIPDNSVAALYPSQIAISNVSGLIGKASVTLADVNHPRPSDLAVLLVSPSGGKFILMRGADTNGPLNHARLLFEMVRPNGGALLPIPATSLATTFGVTSTNMPTDVGSGNLASPAPPGPYSTNLNLLNSTDPNGTWSLYVVDTVAGNAGTISGGWILNLFLAPTVGNIASQSVAEDTDVTIDFPVADLGGAVTSVQAFFPSALVSNIVSATVSGTPPNQSGRIVIHPLTNAVGTTTLTIVSTDTNSNPGPFTGTNFFQVTWTPVNDAPTNSFLNKLVTRAGIPVGPTNFTIGDVETPAANLVVTATSDNPKLLPDGSIVLGGAGATRTVTLYPAGIQPGVAHVSISISDGTNTTTDTFEFDVIEAGNPLFDNGGGLISINDNGAASPYPSSIFVNNLSGNISKVEVSLLGLTHPKPDDIDVLLVGPTGKQIVLMSDAGGSVSITNVQLVISDSATVSLPDEAEITSGTYKPSNYEGSETLPAPAPAPPGTPDTTLAAAFNGTNPNGEWKLFISDDTAGPRGGIFASGWQLSIQTTPKITSIASPQITDEDTQKRVAIIIGDSQPGVSNITVSATASGIPANLIQSIAIEGTGATRTLTITPTPNLFGTNTITVAVTNGAFFDVASFIFIVNSVNDAPAITAIGPVSTPAAMAVGPIAFSVSDIETPAANLSVSVDSSNKSLVPNANITLNNLGNGNWTLNIQPEGNQNGQTTITLTVTDTDGLKTPTSFVLTVTPNVSFTRTDPIVINDFTAASPYPSTINVKNVSGNISKVSVSLLGFSHPFPDDVDILLVGPDGTTSAMLMSDAGGGNAVSGLRLNFTQTAGTPISDSGPLSSGTFRPANYLDTQEGNETALPSPAPAGPGGYQANLNAFIGGSPNGDWKLFVRDDTFSDAGVISGGWILIIETAPTIQGIGTQTTPEDTARGIDFIVSDADTDPTNLVVTISSNGIPANLISSVTFSGASNTRTLTVFPTANLSGTNQITLTVSDGTSSNSTSFSFVVTPVNDAPVVTTATNRIDTLEDVGTNIVFTVSDIDSTLGTNLVTIISSNPTLIPSGNIVISGPNSVAPAAVGQITVSFSPAANEFGTGNILFVLSDGVVSVTNTVTVNVVPVNDAPSISTIDPQFVSAGDTTTNINFTVSDVGNETQAKSLIVTATSSDITKVPTNNIILGGSGNNRTVQIVTIGTVTGAVTITLTVSDTSASNSTASTQFTLNLTAPLGSEFANTAPITIRDNNTALPYPSTITVSNMIGGISRIAVTLDGFAHTAPDDVDILLVGPAGQKVILLSDVGGRNAVSNVRLRFEDNGRLLADDAPITSGTNAPSNYDSADVFPSPAPDGPYTSRFSEFNNTNPNGVWSLYVVDDTLNDAGQIAFGWSIKITTGPTIAAVSPTPVVWNEDSSGLFIFTIGDMVTPADQLQLFYSTDETLLPLNGIISNRVGNNIALALNSARNKFGTNNLNIRVVRPSDGASAEINVPYQVVAQNDLPTISRLTPKFTDEGVPIVVEFLVDDVDTALSNLVVSATSGNQTVIGNTNILLFGRTNVLRGIPTNLVALTLIPNPTANGVSTITVSVSDDNGATSVSSNFTFTVTPFNDPPTISVPVSTIAVPAGTSTSNINFTVGDPEGGILTISVASSDATVVKPSNIIIDQFVGPPGARTVRVVTEPGVLGNPTVAITLTVTDDGGKIDKASFNVNVRETRERIVSNAHSITINQVGAATDYPSPLLVSGFAGTLSKLTVTLNGFSHTFPDDVDILLVSPNSTKVILMSDAGGGVGVAGLNLKFDQAAADPIPDSSSLFSGTFKPANYDVPDAFPAPAPAAPYGSSLDAFNGVTPNGTWNLYVVDDTPSDSGVISGGWSLGITTQPIINGLTNLSGSEDIALRQSFTIAEESFGSTNFTFTATSTNPAVAPTNGISFSGSGTNWNVTVSPATNAAGTSEITVILTNPDGQVVSSKFLVTFAPVNDQPIISPINDQTIAAGGISPVITFTFSDVETANKDLQLLVTSSNPALIPTNNVLISGNELRIITIGNATGSSIVTIRVSDGSLTNVSSFLVTVTPSPTPLFINTNAITINDNNKATPYPSTITVSNLAGTVAKVTVTLVRFNHTFPDDVDILLVGPSGERVVLMSDAGASTPVVNGRLTFDDAATDSVPDLAPINPIATYKPSNYEGSEVFPAPAPGTPYAAALSTFNGTNPNGPWSLYIQDDASPDFGNIAGGWQLNIQTTAPFISKIDDQQLIEDTAKNVDFAISDGDTGVGSLITEAIVTNGPPVVGVGIIGAGATRTLTIIPLPNATGTNTVIVSVSDGVTRTSTSFTVVVSPVNDAPTISGLANTNTPSNVRLRVDFTVTDPDNSASNVTVAASISNPAVGTVSIEGSNTTRTLVFTPSGLTPTNATITVIASDGVLSTTNSIVISVTGAVGPTISSINDQLIFEDTPISVAFTVVRSGGTNLTVTASSSNSNVVSNVVVSGTDTNRTVDITVVPNASGSSTITITATDAFGTQSRSFNLVVIPVNDTPTLGTILDQFTQEDVPVTVGLNVADVETGRSNLTYTASASNSNLVSTIIFTQTASNVLARINLVTNQSGASAITLTVSDGTNTASQTFALSVSTVNDAPILGAIQNQTVFEDAPLTLILNVSDAETPLSQLTFSSTNTRPSMINRITFNNNGTTVAANIELVPNGTGTGSITISVSDGTNTASTTFTLTVLEADNDAPTFGVIADQTTDEDVTLTLTLNLSDPETPISGLTLSSTNSNTNLISSITFNTSGSNALAIISLVTNASGTASVTLSASDGTNSASRSFNLTVRAVDDPPVIATIGTKTINEDEVLSLPITVTDVDTPFASLRFSGSSTNTGLVKSVTVAVAGSNVTATVALVTNASGTATISITAQDATNTVTQTFTLNVIPVIDRPILTAIPNQATTPGVAVTVPLTVTDPDRALIDLLFSSSVTGSSNVITSVAFSNNGTNATATINLVANASGTNQVTITVTDPFFSTLSDSKQFTLTVAKPPAPQLTVARSTPGRITIGLKGAANSNYVIERSSNFTSWSDVITLTTDASGNAQVDLSTTSPVFQFFRARAQ